jgi:hypothetical protein
MILLADSAHRMGYAIQTCFVLRRAIGIDFLEGQVLMRHMVLLARTSAKAVSGHLHTICSHLLTAIHCQQQWKSCRTPVWRSFPWSILL